MDIHLFERMQHDGLIDPETLEKIKHHNKEGLVSVHWDVLSLLYLGIFLFTTGIGIIIHKNIDSIGQTAITLSIAAACAVCFWYGLKNAPGFSTQKVQSPNVLADYIVLLGCLLMLILIGYVQYQYNAFGNRWGMAVFIPMVVLFIVAYYFDHIGMLSMAITNLAAWVGISITPLRLLKDNDFNSHTIIYSSIGLGGMLIGVASLSAYQNVKKHFAFTYKHFGTHLLLIALLAAIIVFSTYHLLWFLLMISVCCGLLLLAVRERSLYFLVVIALYFYIGASYVVISNLFKLGGNDGLIYLALLYLIASAIGLVVFIMHYNKKLKAHVGIQ